jgi:hypothetical protein
MFKVSIKKKQIFASRAFSSVKMFVWTPVTGSKKKKIVYNLFENWYEFILHYL